MWKQPHIKLLLLRQALALFIAVVAWWAIPAPELVDLLWSCDFAASAAWALALQNCIHWARARGVCCPRITAHRPHKWSMWNSWFSGSAPVQGCEWIACTEAELYSLLYLSWIINQCEDIWLNEIISCLAHWGRLRKMVKCFQESEDFPHKYFAASSY